MENNKYLDKVIGSLVRSTRIDYEKERIYFSFFSYNSLFSSFFSSLPPSPLLSHFSKYCKNTFGLTEEEIDYVWEEFKSNIIDKIKNNEQ